MKICSKCRKELETKMFGINRTAADGYNAACKSCKRKRDRLDVSRTGRTRKAAERIKRAGYQHLLVNSDILPGVLEALHLLYGSCGRCGSTRKLTTDHVIPIQKRGTHTIDNIGFLCPGCNAWKRDRIIRDYRGILFLDVILFDPKSKLSR